MPRIRAEKRWSFFFCIGGDLIYAVLVLLLVIWARQSICLLLSCFSFQGETLWRWLPLYYCVHCSLVFKMNDGLYSLSLY
ncbi:hypothetical protein CS542_02190 [Pedobacter sp. IW39]|nr:hypothetical protein CS542_02190 [Pedobacter sp. IW39]